MPRFVVQQHFRSPDDWHYDLMLEHGDVLVTFSSGSPPDDLASLPCLVRQLRNHRLAYLEHEGEISRNRGWCKIHDRGTFEWIEPRVPTGLNAAADTTHVTLADRLVLHLAGEKAKGVYRLSRETKSGADYWRLRLEST